MTHASRGSDAPLGVNAFKEEQEIVCSGGDYDAREGTHDDLVLALAIALFCAEHPSPWILGPVGR